ncbi:MAG TPA: hypothetical protein VIH11_06865 [Gemmatimonadaceae bacterium]|nr:MAG: hypothetical protein A3D33_09245 [Candidatus Rokubacteria bacterium RIFCSPHIGHO2_02_FULL_73_26]OGL13045.1 MAG: hypothetical protein A3I14_12235 [Candidatus Rokubacteria bacterium RIFCSPLOWO2_02_FULL_73_56]HLA24466.1 hypothetical protein [bacterium]
MSFEPDMIVYSGRKPVVVIEAKGNPVPERFKDSIVQQLRAYSTDCNSMWFLLADPVKTAIYRTSDAEQQPVASLATEYIIAEAIRPKPEVVGEQTLLFALDKVLHDRRSLGRLADANPRLKSFVTDVSSASAIETADDIGRKSRST